MTGVMSVCLIAAAYLLVFLEALGFPFRHWLGTQIDFLPGLMVYAGLKGGLVNSISIALIGGILFDSVSANPLAISVLPLLVVGGIAHWNREVVLQDQLFAQFVLGTISSAAAPLMTVVSLYGIGASPLLGWGSLWQWLLLALGGGLATPLIFQTLIRFEKAFSHPPLLETSYRADREIKRGRI